MTNYNKIVLFLTDINTTTRLNENILITFIWKEKEKKYGYIYNGKYKDYLEQKYGYFTEMFIHWLIKEIVFVERENKLEVFDRFEKYKRTGLSTISRLTAPSLRQIYKYLTFSSTQQHYQQTQQHNELRKKYASHLKLFGKSLFDPFKRKNSTKITILFKDKNDNICKKKQTTLSQLIFFKFYFQNCIWKIGNDIMNFSKKLKKKKFYSSIPTTNINTSTSTNTNTIIISPKLNFEDSLTIPTINNNTFFIEIEVGCFYLFRK